MRNNRNTGVATSCSEIVLNLFPVVAWLTLLTVPNSVRFQNPATTTTAYSRLLVSLSPALLILRFSVEDETEDEAEDTDPLLPL